MIVAISTSSPVSSIALFEEDGVLLWAGERNAPGRASEACAALFDFGLAETSRELSQSTLFIADVGPGSFTGVRVGIVLAKTLAWSFRVGCAAIDAFDLVDPLSPVAIPAQKGVFLVRDPGCFPIRTDLLPPGIKAYGDPDRSDYPVASRAMLQPQRLVKLSPLELMPKYLAEPSISTPKRPLSRISV
jgi:tRNA threonylcarbamoyladenosine biosynthesis protein TsaB